MANTRQRSEPRHPSCARSMSGNCRRHIAPQSSGAQNVEISPADYDPAGRCNKPVQSDVEADRTSRRRGYQCVEVITVMRSVVERATEWATPVCVAQMDFARAYDSVRHGAGTRAMARRQVPRVAQRACGVPTPRLGDGGEQPHRRSQARLQYQPYDVSLVHGGCVCGGSTRMGGTAMWAIGGRQQPRPHLLCGRYVATGGLGGGARLDDRDARHGRPKGGRTRAPTHEVYLGSDPAPRSRYAGAAPHGTLYRICAAWPSFRRELASRSSVPACRWVGDTSANVHTRQVLWRAPGISRRSSASCT